MLSRVSQFTQHFNSSVRSHTGTLKKMFHKFILFCLFCWSLTGKLQKLFFFFISSKLNFFISCCVPKES